MTVFRFAFVQCLWRLRWTLPAILLITATVMYVSPEPTGAGAEAERTAVLWLHIPSFFVTAAALAAIVEAWPLFARGRPGADCVARLQPGAMGGCLAVSSGALLALSVWLVIVGVVFAGLLGAFGTDTRPLRDQHRLTQAPMFLDAKTPELKLRGPADMVVAAVLLRPRSILPPGTDFETTAVRITADGEDLHEGEVQLGGHLEDYRLSFAPRQIGELVIRRGSTRGSPLMFGADSIRSVGATTRSWILGCVVGACTYLFPAALALALACLLRQRLALPIAVVGMLAVLTASTVADLTPSTSAITALSRGRWLLGEGVYGTGPAVLAGAIGIAILAAAILPRGHR